MLTRTLRARALLAVVALTASCGGAPSTPAGRPESCPLVNTGPGAPTLSLVGPYATVRATIADRIARQRLAVLRIAPGMNACEVEVLRCTRPVVWKTTPLRSPGMAAPPWGPYPEPEWSRYDPRRTPEVSVAQYQGSRAPSFVQELVQSGFRSPFFEPQRDEELPPLDASELAGPDCARATHVVRVSHDGAYRTLSTVDHRIVDQSACQPPAGCGEPIDLQVQPVGHRGCPGLTTRTPSGCVMLRRPVRFGGAPPGPRAGDLDDPGPNARPEACIPPVAGQPTPTLARLFDRFRAGDYAGTLADLERAGAGETGDEGGNVQLAQWYFAEAARLTGDFAGAVGALEAIAQRCHGYRRRAVAILAIAQLRATVPPIE